MTTSQALFDQTAILVSAQSATELRPYVIGGCDRNYIVIGTAPVYATNWSDVHPDKTGWKVFDHSYRVALASICALGGNGQDSSASSSTSKNPLSRSGERDAHSA